MAINILSKYESQCLSPSYQFEIALLSFHSPCNQNTTVNVLSVKMPTFQTLFIFAIKTHEGLATFPLFGF